MYMTTEQRSAFEAKARLAGYSNFNRKGMYYAHSDLNLLAQGYLMGVSK